MTPEFIEALVIGAVAYVLGTAALVALAWAFVTAFGSTLEPKDKDEGTRK